MELNDSQKSAVREWVAAGASLSEVQKRLQEEFGVRMTFMDVRLMVLDIGATIIDKPDPKPAKPAPVADAGAEADAEAADGEADAAPAGDLGADGALGGVSVEMDRVVQPGMLISGTASFSDGVTAKWGIDQMGRVAFQPSQEGYRPSDADLRDFQTQLRAIIEQQGYGY